MGESAWTAAAAQYAEHGRYVAELGRPLVDLLAPRPGERVLDLGCGDGVLTREIVGRGAQVVGVDASADMVRVARQRGVDARVMDGRALVFDAEFDAVFTNAALHWMPEVDAVLDGVARALRPAGRFVGELGGHGNVAALRVALAAALERHGAPGPAMPLYFPTAPAFRSRLEAHGFTDTDVTLWPRPTPLPTGIDGWLDTYAEAFLRRVDGQRRDATRHDVVRLLRPVLCDEQGSWTADYVRLRFTARRGS